MTSGDDCPTIYDFLCTLGRGDLFVAFNAKSCLNAGTRSTVSLRVNIKKLPNA